MTDRPDLHTLTGAYAVDALPEDEREEFEQHLIVCAACAREVTEFQATASRLATGIEAMPSPDLRARVLAEIDGTRQERPRAARDAVEVADDLAARRRRRNRVTAALVSVAAAVVVIAGVGVVSTITDLNERVSQVEVAAAQVTDVLASPDAVTVSAEGPDGIMGRVVASPTRGEAVFVAADLAPLGDDQVYELWLIDDEPRPAGLLAPDDRGRASRVMTGDVAGAVAVGVTIEPAGGSPAPTSAPIMVFDLTA